MKSSTILATAGARRVTVASIIRRLCTFGFPAKCNSQADQNREEQKIDRVDPKQIMKLTDLMKPAFSRDAVERQNLAEQHDDCGKSGHKYAQALVQPDAAGLDEPRLNNKSDPP